MISRVTRLFDGQRQWCPPAALLRTLRRFLPSRLHLVAGLVVAVAIAFSAGSAQAQLTPQQKLEMKQHYEKATRAYDVQKYNEAVDEYQKAYEIGGDPAMLYNVAQSYRLADQLPDALRFYRRYLQRSPNARNREDVERKIADLERILEERRKAAAAVTTPPPAPPVVAPPPATPPPTVVRDEGMSGLRIAGIVTAAVGGAALITAGITAKLAHDKSDRVSKASTRGEQFDPNWESSGKNLNRLTIASAIAGGALAVTGVVLIIVGGSSSSEGGAVAAPRASLTPVVGTGTWGGAASFRF